MTAATLARPTVTITDELRAEAARVVEQAGGERFRRVTITTETGNTVLVPGELAEVLDTIVRRMQQGGQIVLSSIPELLTTSAAADILGVSRPTLVKMIDDGKLPATMRGSHRRVRWTDLSAFKHAREAERGAAVAELIEAEFGGE